MNLGGDERPPSAAAGTTRAQLTLVAGGRATVRSDAELAIAAMAGSVSAGEQLVVRHATLVRRIIVGHVGPRDVDDLQQEVFLHFFRKLPTLRDPQATRSFLVAITLNTLRYELRQRRVRRLLFWNDTPADFEQMPAPTVEVPVSAKRMVVLLDQLQSDTRTLFLLRYVEGLELKELAEALEVSLSTIKRRLRRATDHLLVLARKDPELHESFRAFVERVS